MSFNINDRVEVTAEIGNTKGLRGTVIKIYPDTCGFLVKLDESKVAGYFESELVLVDPKREALITLAETLDKARQQANAIEETADQNGVYGRIVNSLTDTLGAMFYMDGKHFTYAYKAYELMMEDGLTVREALKEVEK